ncbi:hypothetical protein [Methanoculleus chikugoensis]|uniref:hypothetical protein n=1 Tax=Methanoculleus chikugoensis TaxID=118126 RepID=UPI001FB28C03|nr:hypothetical protein [Methanoculleus chikugoensis]
MARSNGSPPPSGYRNRFSRPVAIGRTTSPTTHPPGRPGVMFAKGCRPDGANQHPVRFARLFPPGEGDVLIFDRMRRKRHSSVCGRSGICGERR